MLAAALSTCEAMKYKEEERDMIVMHHELLVKMKDGSYSRRLATMFEYGNDKGTAMARTVGITTAIGAQMVLDKTIPETLTGVHRPFLPEVYLPAYNFKQIFLHSCIHIALFRK